MTMRAPATDLPIMLEDASFIAGGVTILERISLLLGAGRPTGIEYPGERKGLVPDSAWKERVYHEKWYPGNTPVYTNENPISEEELKKLLDRIRQM